MSNLSVLPVHVSKYITVSDVTRIGTGPKTLRYHPSSVPVSLTVGQGGRYERNRREIIRSSSIGGGSGEGKGVMTGPGEGRRRSLLGPRTSGTESPKTLSLRFPKKDSSFRRLS